MKESYRRYFPCLSLYFLVFPLLASAQTRTATTAAPILQIPLGARAVGMGTAFTAIGGDPYSIHYNPAALGLMEDREASFLYLKGFEDQGIEDVTFASPLPYRGLSGEGYATAGGSLLFSQNGSIEVNRTNADGSFLDSRTLDAGSDLVATFGYAEKVLDMPVEAFGPPQRMEHFLGISGKIVRSTLAEQYSATAYAADLGYLARFPDSRWAAGASILNVGTKMKFVSEGDPLPLSFRAGVTHWLPLAALNGEDNTLNLALDGDYSVYEGLWHVNAGTEYMLGKLAAARMGYEFHRDVAGLTIGLGVRLDSFQLDYAWAMSDALTDTHRFSVTYKFGRARAAERESSRPARTRQVPVRRGKSRPSQSRPPSETEQGAPDWIY